MNDKHLPLPVNGAPEPTWLRRCQTSVHVCAASIAACAASDGWIGGGALPLSCSAWRSAEARSFAAVPSWWSWSSREFCRAWMSDLIGCWRWRRSPSPRWPDGG
ncbi:hypothetical protein AB0F91_02730 [Amycolatopsis sp. NPDC023774]|uniref:hypothetical protein n=1 Tax=Amycolatopsis sp. NPDC023774 TaxID=3155015 RepID=UPI0033C8024C